MNVLQVAISEVYPPTSGGRHRSHGLVCAFSRRGTSVQRYCQGGPVRNYLTLELNPVVEVDDQYVEFRDVHPLNHLAHLPVRCGTPNVFLKEVLRRRKGGAIRTHIRWADVVVVELPWQAPAVFELVADEDPDTPVVFSSHNVEYERFQSVYTGVMRRLFDRAVRSVERRALTGADLVVCTSRRDADLYADSYAFETPVVIAPNGVPSASLRPDEPSSAARRAVRRRHDIGPDDFVGLFVGTAYGPNTEAAEFLVDLASAHPDSGIEFLIVGSVGETVGDTATSVTTTGYVDDIEPYFAAADVGLNPMFSGSGTNIKLLDYLARRLPALSTPFGTRGLDLTDGEHLFVAERDEFFEALRSLGDDPRLSEVARKGYERVEQRYTWERISAALHDDLRDLVVGPPA